MEIADCTDAVADIPFKHSQGVNEKDYLFVCGEINGFFSTLNILMGRGYVYG